MVSGLRATDSEGKSEQTNTLLVCVFSQSLADSKTHLEYCQPYPLNLGHIKCSRKERLSLYMHFFPLVRLSFRYTTVILHGCFYLPGLTSYCQFLCHLYLCSSDPSPPLFLLQGLYTSPVYQIRQRLWKGHSSTVGPWQPLPCSPPQDQARHLGYGGLRAALPPSRLPEAPSPVWSPSMRDP